MPTPSFSILDIAVVIIYLLGVTFIGIWVSRGQGSKRDYFLGGRSLSWWVVGFSIVATETSALTFIGVPAQALGSMSMDEQGVFSVAGGNLMFIQLILGYVIGRTIIAFKIVPMYFKGDVYTPYQLLKRAFGDSARYVASGLQLVGMALGAAVRVYVVAIPLTLLMMTAVDNWSVRMSVVVIMFFALIYTAFGGIKAVVWTDMIQYFIFVGGGLFALFYVPTLIDGVGDAPGGWAAVFEVGKENLKFFNLGWEFGEPLSKNLHEMFFGPYNIIMGIFPTTLGIIFAFGFDQMNVQRVLGCKTQKEGAKAMMFSAGLIFPQFLLFLMIGVVLFAFYTLNDWALGMDPWDPGNEGKPNASFIFPIFIITQTPVIIKGFLIAGIVAAAMSSVSSALSAMGSMITMDFYRPLKGGKSDPHTELVLSRVITIISGVALGGLAVMFVGTEDIIGLAFTVAGLTAGGILGAFIYGMIVKGGHPLPVVVGIISSFVFMSVLNVLMGGDLKPFINKVFEFDPVMKTIAWPWHATIGMVVCFIGIFATRPFVESRGGDISSTEGED